MNFNRPRDTRIVYENQSLTFTQIFGYHPLRSEKNAPIFKKIGLTDKDTPSGTTVLDTTLTFDFLKKVAQNSLEDVHTFFEVSSKTVRKFIKDKDFHDNWYKSAMTALWLSCPDAPEKLNYSKELPDLRKSVSLVVENFDLSAYREMKSKIDISYEEVLATCLRSKKIPIQTSKEPQMSKSQKMLKEIIEYENKPLEREKFSSLVDGNNLNPYAFNIFYEKYKDAYTVLDNNSDLKSICKITLSEPRQTVMLKDIYDIMNVCSCLNKHNPVVDAPPFKDFSFALHDTASILKTLDKNNKLVVQNVAHYLKELADKKSAHSSYYSRANLELTTEDKSYKKSKKI